MPVLIPVPNPGPLTGSGNNTWLLDGAAPALVDAGTGAPAHLDALAAALAGRPLSDVFVTHGHPDHASGVPALRQRWPGLRAHKWLTDVDAQAVGGEWQALADGQRVRAGDRVLEVVHTPGHAPDHVCFWDAASRDLFGGDMLISGSTVMIPTGRGGNLRAYLASLDRMAAFQPVRVLPGHGPVIDDPASLISQYLEHRRLREAQVLACLADGVFTLDGIVARVYPALRHEVVPAARLTIAAHLEKLREEGKY